MTVESKIDLILLKQGLIHVYNYHSEYEIFERKKIEEFPNKRETSSLHFHFFRKERAKKLIDDINFNLDKIATAEKADS